MDRWVFGMDLNLMIFEFKFTNNLDNMEFGVDMLNSLLIWPQWP